MNQLNGVYICMVGGGCHPARISHLKSFLIGLPDWPWYIYFVHLRSAGNWRVYRFLPSTCLLQLAPCSRYSVQSKRNARAENSSLTTSIFSLKSGYSERDRSDAWFTCSHLTVRLCDSDLYPQTYRRLSHTFFFFSKNHL